MFNPYFRPRRLRQNENIRRMVRETALSINDMVYPLFVTEGKGVKNPVNSMPGVCQLSTDLLVDEVREVNTLGIPAIILFGIPAKKDPMGSDATSDEGIIQRSVRAIKDAVPEMYVITDVCFCEYTDHGHCGAIVNGELDNDATLEMLGRQVVTHAKAGVDMVAPSGMIDGMVGAIRDALDENNYANIPIMSYAAKYASAFYGPFRDAAESTPQFGDRRSYQMDPANAREALFEVELDVAEGADIIMVKPAMPYLDIIARVRQEIDLPVAAYNVSGEYSLVKAAGQLGWVDEKRVALEMLTSIKRAGADIILTYFAKEAAGWLSE
ncbi:MAG: porphobilinogen synthase [Candidatus Latescibacteria bacterium]|nr:porphobilinogen synthase [Candidatus Latescibacterota bacterium]NIO27176.1 porphobilinogen synthase [Candidatus Latescibacterota bacterium]NIO54700.1 porphobilinogen synthase [Candidatus Latescibacterota bacterium]NIT00783.1 porphobilinogen synthase [Candidatus Latescibacterota bacterium]NIT37706.1 porphobilinogen synthase [Candidatus Latescibacterota bacterium]